MKKTLLILGSALLLFAFVSKKNITFYGKEFDYSKAISTSEFIEVMSDRVKKEVTVKATIHETCTKMGCWMSINMPEDKTIMVFMGDHDFFVPKSNCDGLECYIQGFGYQDTVSVEMLKHLAEDAQKPQEYIDAITEPKFEMGISATGVAIVGYEE